MRESLSGVWRWLILGERPLDIIFLNRSRDESQQDIYVCTWVVGSHAKTNQPVQSVLRVFYFSPYKNTQNPFVKTPQNYYYDARSPLKALFHPPSSTSFSTAEYPCWTAQSVNQSMAVVLLLLLLCSWMNERTVLLLIPKRKFKYIIAGILYLHSYGCCRRTDGGLQGRNSVLYLVALFTISAMGLVASTKNEGTTKI